MFLKDTDYNTAITDDDLQVVQQSDPAIRQAAELSAIELMSGYLRSRYDVGLIFTPAGTTTDARSKIIVMYCIDLALYNLFSSIPGRFVSENRRQRYEDAIKWLESVQSGKVDPGLPLKNDSAGAPVSSIIFGSNQQSINDW
jgi:phage gp36-like protein